MAKKKKNTKHKTKNNKQKKKQKKKQVLIRMQRKWNSLTLV